MAFLAPIDIKNRALDHCGQDPLDPAAELTDGKKGRLCARVYDKLRQAELRRNIWVFSIRSAILRSIDTTTMLLAPALWTSTTTFFRGSIVADATGQPWISRIPNNLGNDPLTTLAWEQYFGPLTVSLYSSTTSYFAGELVYTAAGDGTNRVFVSLQSANSDNPATATAWSATATYFKNQVVTASSVAYMSLIDLNIAQTPSASAANWASGTSYALNALVNGSDGVTYRSLAGSNVGNDPTIDAGVHWLNTGVLTAWTTVFTGGTGSLKWLQIGGAEFPNGVGLTTLNIVYPLGAGPSSQSMTRNAFRVPASFLRRAPTDPKAGSTSSLGMATNLAYTDWNFEGAYITSTQVDPIMLRFAADVVDVSTMDAMFCEGLGARIGVEVCEPLTQSSDKLKTIASEYERFMGDARLVNAIQVGAEEPPLDDYLAVRA